MTVRDPEILELLKDDPELLALADAVGATQRPPAPARVRRALPRAALVAGLAAAIVLVVFLWPGGGRNGILDRALAAIGNGPVFHLVTRTPTGVELYDLRTGHRRVETFESELWRDESTKRTHLVMREGGRVLGDVLLPDDLTRNGGTVGRADPAFAALLSGYRTALESGRAKLERKGRIAGHRVFWLAFPSVQARLPGTEVAIDRRTYKPVVFRSHTGVGHVDSRVLVAETTAFRPSEFTRLGPSPFSGRNSSGGSSESGTDARALLRAPWLTAGPRVAGLPLAAVHQLTVTTDRPTARAEHGFHLFYGKLQLDGEAGPRSLAIQELSGPDDPGVWKNVPSGALMIERGTASNGRRTYGEFTGYAIVRGIYVTIETGRGEAALVAAARALRPV